MKKILLFAETAFGFAALLGGLLIYGFGAHELLPVPRPDLVVVGTTIIGILLIISGACDIFMNKSKEIEIEQKDERNIALSNAAMASGFKTTSTLLSVAIFALIFTGYLNVVSCLTIICVFLAGQIVFVARLWYLNNRM